MHEWWIAIPCACCQALVLRILLSESPLLVLVLLQGSPGLARYPAGFVGLPTSVPRPSAFALSLPGFETPGGHFFFPDGVKRRRLDVNRIETSNKMSIKPPQESPLSVF